MSEGHDRDDMRNEEEVDSEEYETKVGCLRPSASQLETAEGPRNVVDPKSEWFEQRRASDDGGRNGNTTRQGTTNCEMEGKMKKT